MIPDAGRPTAGAGRKALVVPAMGAPSRLTEAAESRQVCKSVNLGTQAVEVAELALVQGLVTLLIIRFSVAGLRTQEPEWWLGSLSAVPPAQSIVASF